MKSNNFFNLLNTRHKSVAIVSPKNKDLELALKQFAVLAVKSTFRVVLILDEQGQCDAFLKYFHMELTNRYSETPVVHSLTYGGTLKCMTYEQFRDTPENLNDVIIVHKNEMDLGMSLDISELTNFKKLIISTRRSEEYLGCMVNSYHIFNASDLQSNQK